jgi:hypothetical protein
MSKLLTDYFKFYTRCCCAPRLYHDISADEALDELAFFVPRYDFPLHGGEFHLIFSKALLLAGPSQERGLQRLTIMIGM